MRCTEMSKRHCTWRAGYRSKTSTASLKTLALWQFLTACSQLLDLLLDLNESTHIPGFLRFDLSPELPSVSAVPSLEPDINDELVKPKPLSRLLEVPHTIARDNMELPLDMDGQSPPAYLDTYHEEEYLSALDSLLSNPSAMLDDHSGRPIRLTEPPKLSDKDLATRNPVSVYQWLRRNQPHVFLQDFKDEAASEKGARGVGKGKRKSVANEPISAGTPAALKGEYDWMDEGGEGSVAVRPEGGGSGRGKRSKDDEPYRPKGGSSRPAKRKREDGEKGGRKKSRIGGGTPS